MKKTMTLIAVSALVGFAACDKTSEEIDNYVYEPPKLEACQVSESTTRYGGKLTTTTVVSFDNQGRSVRQLVTNYDTLGAVFSTNTTRYEYEGTGVLPRFTISISKPATGSPFVSAIEDEFFEDGRLRKKTIYGVSNAADSVSSAKTRWTVNNAVEYFYFSSKRLEKTVDSRGVIQQYNRNSKLIYSADPCCFEYRAVYDGERIVSENNVSKCCGGGKTATTYDYGANGKVSHKTEVKTDHALAILNGRFITAYTYDAQNRVMKEEVTQDDKASRKSEYTYSADGSYERKDYNESQKLQSRAVFSAKGVMLSSQTYDANGTLVNATETTLNAQNYPVRVVLGLGSGQTETQNTYICR